MDDINYLNSHCMRSPIPNSRATYVDLDFIKNLKHNSYLHINIRSLDANNNKLNNLLNNINHNVDILYLTEVHENKLNSKINLFPKTFYNLRPQGKGGGVGILFKENSNPKKISNMSIMDNSFESIAIENKGHIHVSIYRPPKNDLASINSFLNQLNNILYIKERDHPHKQITLMGDFNLNLLLNNPHINNLNNIIQDYSLFLSIDIPTRYDISRNSQTILDIIISSNDPLANNFVILDSITDHLPILHSFRKTSHNNNNHNKFKEYRKFSEEETIHFKLLLINSQWDSVFEAENCTQKWDAFFTQFDNIFNQAFPIHKSKIKKPKWDDPWINPELKNKLKLESKLYTRKIKSKARRDEEIHKSFKKTLEKEIRVAKNTYLDSFFKDNSKNPRKTWSKINSMLNKPQKSSEKINEIKINNQTITNDKEIASNFNNFFVSVGTSLANSLAIDRNAQQTYIEDIENSGLNKPQFKFTPISIPQLIKIAKKIKNKRSHGPDMVPTFIAKATCLALPEVLQHLINSSLTSGQVPTRLKQATVIPLHKKGDSCSMNNYRPISLLNSFSKLLEKCASIQLIKHLESHNLLFLNQFGFRNFSSTTHAMLCLMNKLEKSFKDKLKVTGLFIDLKKAFDTTNTNIILSKLKSFGVFNTELEWFKSYLSNRSQNCKVNDTLSDFLNVTIGVPQGSILGPLLFIIYINDLPNFWKVWTILFADDTSSLTSQKTSKEVETNLNNDLKDAAKWFSFNELSLNTDKTRVINFKNHSKPNIHLNNISIKEIHSQNLDKEEQYIKFLGYCLDETVNLKSHYNKVIKKLINANFALRKLKNQINHTQKILIYNSIFKPFMDYGSIIWSNSIEREEKILKLQKKAIINIHGSSSKTHSEPLFKKYKILKFKDSKFVQTINLAHSVIYNRCPQAVKDCLPLEEEHPIYNLRHDIMNFKVNNSNPKSLCDSIIPNAWNNLSPNLKNIEKAHIMKKTLKKQILEGYSNNPNCDQANCRICT